MSADLIFILLALWCWVAIPAVIYWTLPQKDKYVAVPVAAAGCCVVALVVSLFSGTLI